MDYEGIIFEKEAGIATITLNRPERLNALSAGMNQSLRTALDEIRDDDAVRVLILTGTGRAFCAGGDLTASERGRERTRRQVHEHVAGLSHRLHNLPKPTIAAVNGLAYGGGLSIAMLCDMRIASEKATFCSAYAKIGMMPDLNGTYTMPRLVGVAKAMEMALTADPVDAAEALRIGLVNRVVPDGDLMKASRELAGKIAGGAPLASEQIKLILNLSLQNSFEAQLELEDYGGYILRKSEDHAEGVKAFLEKRKPVFKGK